MQGNATWAVWFEARFNFHLHSVWPVAMETERESTESTERSCVILFYCYQDLPCATSLAAQQRSLGSELGLFGRVLVAPEGINGTVQGTTDAISIYEASVQKVFSRKIDWKSSKAEGVEPIFPDFVVKEVPELVGFGLQERLDVTAEAGIRLSPQEFHAKLIDGDPKDFKLIDVRNTFEYDVGHFVGAIDPGMTHTAQWPRFVKNNIQQLQGRNVMLYCTGGIRCEKASAFLRRRLRELDCESDTPVYQLEGGIHRYLEAFPDGGHFKGANFVFDKRAQMRGDGSVVGRCGECSAPWDTHHGGRVCTVCRALVLVCDVCDASSEHGEYWCPEHSKFRNSYFHFLDRFSEVDLQSQATRLRELLEQEVGGSKNRRTTLRKKLLQVQSQLQKLRTQTEQTEQTDEVAVLPNKQSEATREVPSCSVRRCRTCEKPYAECPGACWGFWKSDGPT